MSSDSTVQSAFALARSGECAGVEDIRRLLKQQRHDQVDAHLSSPSLSRQLRQLCVEATSAKSAATPNPA
jgi:hypothetical protein